MAACSSELLPSPGAGVQDRWFFVFFVVVVLFFFFLKVLFLIYFITLLQDTLPNSHGVYGFDFVFADLESQNGDVQPD